MKFKMTVIGLVAFAMLIIGCNEKPVIVFDSTLHDFGKVQKSSTYKHAFQFRNTGKGKLIIDRIKTG